MIANTSGKMMPSPSTKPTSPRATISPAWMATNSAARIEHVRTLEQLRHALEVGRAAERALTAQHEQVAHREALARAPRSAALARPSCSGRGGVRAPSRAGCARANSARPSTSRPITIASASPEELCLLIFEMVPPAATISAAGARQVDLLRRRVVALEAHLERHDAVGRRVVLEAVGVADLRADLLVDGRDAGGRVVGREDVAAGLAGERLERRVIAAADRDRVDGDAACLGGLDRGGRAWSGVVSSPSVSTTSTLVSVGAVPSSLEAWITES